MGVFGESQVKRNNFPTRKHCVFLFIALCKIYLYLCLTVGFVFVVMDFCLQQCVRGCCDGFMCAVMCVCLAVGFLCVQLRICVCRK